MKVIQYNAISVDGFIATKDGNSDWVSEADVESFEKAINDSGCIIMGRKTFEQYQDDLYPVEGLFNVVMTTNKEILKESDELWITDKSPSEVLKFLEKNKFEQVVLIGGGTINSSFLNLGIVDEIILSIHPIVLGDGIRLFEGDEIHVDLEKVEVKEIGDGVVWVRYKVGKLPNH